MQAWLLKPWAKPLVFMLCLLPCAWLLYAAFTDGLGANPAEALLRSTGDWTLRFLCIVLAVTPLRQISGWNLLVRYRRMLGLYVFFYACLHLLCYAWFDMGFDGGETLREWVEDPASSPGDLEALARADEASWLEEREAVLLYR